jgi:2-polyprenyl-3-methyl-5-hydroxy-6-metoxy-1,4-benzoquinol methylase
MSKHSDALLHANHNTFEGYPVPMQALRVRRIVELMGDRGTGRLLDVGCADGQFGEYTTRFGWQPFGIDINARNATLALQRGVISVSANLAHTFPYARNSFEAITAMEILEHIVDTTYFLSECRRVLKPGGHLYLSTPNLASVSNRIRLVFGKYPSWMDYRLENTVGHVRNYTLPILKQHLAEIGFHVEQARGTIFLLPLMDRLRFFEPERSRLLGWIGSHWPSMSIHLIITATKIDKP